jgi:hypothetical protein
MSTALIYFLLGLFLAIVTGIVLQRFLGFRSQKPDDYAGQGQDFDIRKHLNGPMICEGVIYGPTGRVNTRFVANMNAKWVGNSGHMTEEFRYDTGGSLDREWTLRLSGDGDFMATAPDIVGVGKGRQAGSAVELKYAIKLPESAGGHVLDTTDWMYLMENGTIINRSQMRKFGIKVGELVATIRKAA